MSFGDVAAQVDWCRGGTEPFASFVAPLRKSVASDFRAPAAPLVRAQTAPYDLHMRTNDRATSVDGLCDVPCFKQSLVNRLRSGLPSDDELDLVHAGFAAIADRTRLKIIFALRNGEELCVCDVAHVLGMSVSAASHHLRKLRDVKILKFRTDGKMAYYSLRDMFAADLVQLAHRNLKP